MYPFLKKLYADGGYQGAEFQKALAKLLPFETEIVKRSDQAKGFVVLPRRWVVERTIAWLNRCRRLAKDWENLNRKALAFLRLASIRLMLRKLCNPADVAGQLLRIGRLLPSRVRTGLHGISQLLSVVRRRSQWRARGKVAEQLKRTTESADGRCRFR